MTTQRAAAELLAIAIDANVPVLLMGAPGTAKTATIESIAAARGAYLEVLIASAQDPTTILGIPMPTEDRKYTEPTMPGWARRINAAAAEGRPTILFLDELTTVPPSVAAPLLGIVQSRRSDGWTLPADTRIVAAANPPDLAVGGWSIEPAMANRWAHIDWPAPTQEWIAWASGAAAPAPLAPVAWTQTQTTGPGTSQALGVIAEYIAAVPAELLQVPTDLRKRSGAWASPRSWTNAAALIDAAGGDWTLAALTVGERAAQTFAAWAATRDVPTVADLLSGARPLPQRADAWRTAIDNLTAAVTPDTLDRTIAILIDAAPTDPAIVRMAAKTIAQQGQWAWAGMARLTTALQALGA